MKYLYNNKHWPVNKEYNIDKILYLMIDRPNEITELCFAWEIISKNNEIQSHRDYDLPTVIDNIEKTSINLYWEKHNNFHRENNKPAIIYYDGHKKYYLNNKFIKQEHSLK